MLSAALYVHVPWCIRKCPYCDFNSHKSPEHLPEMDYIKALLTDLKQDLAQFPGKKLTSIFIGGGTPSLLSPEAYERFFFELNQLLPFSQKIEITLEANPGTVEQQRFADYRALGINRLSLGIQSFNPNHLKTLGRIHDDTQAHQAIESARGAGFDNINLDIMHGLPNQSLKEGLFDLKTALSYHPEHLSWYQLTIEPNTIFYKTKPVLPPEEIMLALEEEGFAQLNQSGYQRYEISAFCKPGHASEHNLNYWLFGDYYGIGAGAHGKLTCNRSKTVQRTRKYRQPIDYLAQDKSFSAGTNQVSKEALIFEFMLNTTRLEKPIDYTLFTERTGLDFKALAPKLTLAQKKGLIRLTKLNWQVTPLGRQYTNDLQALFLDD